MTDTSGGGQEAVTGQNQAPVNVSDGNGSNTAFGSDAAKANAGTEFQEANRTDTQTKEGEETPESKPGKRVILWKGKPVELTEDEYKEHAERGFNATQRTQKAAETMKKAEQMFAQAEAAQAKAKAVLEKLTQNPIQAAMEAGMDSATVQRITEEFLLQKMQEESLSPEARRVKELEAKIAQDEQLRKQQEETRKKQEFELKKKHFQQGFEKLVTDTVKKHNIPDTPVNRRIIADYMQKALRRGFKINPDQAAEALAEEFDGNVKYAFRGFEDAIKQANDKGDKQSILRELERFEERFGKGIINAIRRADLVRLRSGQPTMPAITAPQQTAKQQPQDTGYLSMDEDLENRKKRVEQLQAQWDRQVRNQI